MPPALKSRITARVASLARQLRATEQPLAFDKNGVARLTTWRFKAPNDHPAVGGRTTEDGRQVLQVRARGGTVSSGAWRTLVLLEDGHYEFTGLGRATGIINTATNSGVILRISGERSPKGLSTNAAWTFLRYEFDIHGIANTELIAEFRSTQGTASFDLSMFRLIRKGTSPATTSAEPEGH